MRAFDIDGIRIELPEALMTPDLTEAFERGRYEMLERRALRLRVQPGDRVLDLGAGIGVTAVEAARITGGANVTAAEPHPALLETLAHTFRLNGIEGVSVENVCVLPDREAGQVPLFERKGFWSASLVDDGSAGIEVAGLGLWDLIDLHRPDVVLCDVEGFEATLFAEPLPDAPRLVIVELHPRRYSARAIQTIFAGMAASGMAYSPKGSRGGVVVFERIEDD